MTAIRLARKRAMRHSPSGIAYTTGAIRRSFGRGIVATRGVFEQDPDVPLIPTFVLLAALRERIERTMSPL